LRSIGARDSYTTDDDVTAAQYDALERAIVNRSRVAIRLNGAELVVIPETIRMVRGREMLVTQNPSSGLPMQVLIDDIERLEVVR
jgi:hypothetical protein